MSHVPCHISHVTCHVAGEDATLSCEGDMEWDTCTWHLPTGARCGPLTTTQTSCRYIVNSNGVCDSPTTHLEDNFLCQEALLNTLATINMEIWRGIFMRISSDIQLNNLALPPRSAGAAGQNILFTGTETNCQIKINSVKNEQSGDWVCR